MPKCTKKTKRFHLGDILSITTHRLVSLRHMAGVRDILSFMTKDERLLKKDEYLEELVSAGDLCRPHLFRQFPQLENVDTSGLNEKNHKQWLAKLVTKYGENFDVKQL